MNIYRYFNLITMCSTIISFLSYEPHLIPSNLETPHPHLHPPPHLFHLHHRQSFQCHQVRVHHSLIRSLVQLSNHQIPRQPRFQRVLEFL